MTHSQIDLPKRPTRVPDGTPARIQLELLMQGQTEVVLVHHGRDYRLRITQTGKLILTT